MTYGVEKLSVEDVINILSPAFNVFNIMPQDYVLCPALFKISINILDDMNIKITYYRKLK